MFDNNVYAQVGLVLLVGLTAKNAILMVEFAKAQLDQGKPGGAAALFGARLRLCPILMTSLAFIFGCLPLWLTTGTGAAARRILGTAVVRGMLAATALGLFFIPALFIAVERLASRGRPPATRPKTRSSAALRLESAPRREQHFRDMIILFPWGQDSASMATGSRLAAMCSRCIKKIWPMCWRALFFV